MDLRTLLLLVVTASGCCAAPSADGPPPMGSLEVQVSVPDGVDISQVALHLDGVFLGNARENGYTFLALPRGDHVVQFEAPGCQRFERRITILGDNRQYLSVLLERG